MVFPDLPARANPWRPGVVIARGQLLNMYLSSMRMIETGNFNRYRVVAHQNVLHTQALPLIQAILEQEPELEHWISSVCKIMLDIDNELDNILSSETTESTSSSIPIKPYTLVHTGRRGRPPKLIDPSAMEWATQTHLTADKIAELFGVSRSTLSKQMKAAGLPTSTRTSNINDDRLQELVRDAMAARPDTGLAYLTGYLRANFQVRVQRWRLRQAVHNVDTVGTVMRRLGVAKKVRGSYHVSRPHALWHIDGHHKLIKWGIVIHGMIDGYSRKIMGLRASTSNSAETVASLFLDAVNEHGVPSRVRGDRGGENRDVSIAMIMLRGSNRGSFMWGPSTRNTPIERNWVELGRRVCRAWRVFFHRLGRLHNLDKTNPEHLWLLHHLFLDVINEECQAYVEEWNAHPMRNRKNMCPNDLELEGMIKFGIYDDVHNKFVFGDECENCTDEEREAYYRYPKERAGSGDEADSGSDEEMFEDRDSEAGFVGNEDEEHEVDHEVWESYSGDEDDEHERDVEDEVTRTMTRNGDEEHDKDERMDPANGIADEVDSNIRHEPVSVPTRVCPLSEEDLANFDICLDHIRKEGMLPPGYGVRQEEWDDIDYPEMEELVVAPSPKTVPIHSFNPFLHPHTMPLSSKRKASPSPPPERDSSVEIVPPPPSTQPAARRNDRPINHPSSLRDVFPGRPRMAISTSTSSSSSSGPSISSGPSTSKGKGKARAMSPAKASSARVGDSAAAKFKLKAEPEPNAIPDVQLGKVNFKQAMTSYIKNEHGDARKETNIQGGKGPGSSQRRTSTKGSIPAPMTRTSDPAEFSVSIIVILPYGVIQETESGNPVWPLLIDHRKCVIADVLAELKQAGFAYRGPPVVFKESWSEDQVFDKIQSVLPRACKLLLDVYDPSVDGPRAWYPCCKESKAREVIISRAMGPYDGATLREIGGNLLKNRAVQTRALYIASTVRLIEEDANMISPLSDSDSDCQPPRKLQKLSNGKQRASSNHRGSQNAKKKQPTPFADEELEDALSGTETVIDREPSPQAVLEASFSGVSIAGPSRRSASKRYHNATERATHEGCTSEIPEEADYFPGTPNSKA
ncbi:hypothetical protein CVT24_008496 [Panaeolus cyanescens]|uniref:Integrase catalytic domain-containing protein n=1 Tax=Panaeolus cyanescens TaxID=181874 RepID=A0A409WD03_9AGAR|nr:hypothetical protein CVT24_008496 [Panaeolus cyanescens]